MYLQEEYDSSNTVLFQKLKLLKNEILQLQNQSKILSNNYVPNDLEVKIEDDDNLKESFSSSLLQLEDKLENLRHLCNSEQIESEDCFIQNNNYSLVYIQFLNNLLSKFVEFITTLGHSYSIVENPDYFDQIKKSISKIRKKIKKIDLNFDPGLFLISEIESEYSLTTILVKNVYKLKKKLSKLISAHRKKYNIPYLRETENSVEVTLKNKKRKRDKTVLNDTNEQVEEKTLNGSKKDKHKSSVTQKNPETSLSSNLNHDSPKKSKKFNSSLSQDDDKTREVEVTDLGNLSPKKSRKESLKDSFSQEKSDSFLSSKTKKVKKDKHENLSQHDIHNDLNNSYASNNEEISPKNSKKNKISLSQADKEFNSIISSDFDMVSPIENDFKKPKNVPSTEETDFETFLSTPSPKKSKKNKREMSLSQVEPEQVHSSENSTLSEEKSPKKQKRISFSEEVHNTSRIDELEGDVTSFLEVNMSCEKTPTHSPKKEKSKVSPNGINNMLSDLISKMNNKLFDEGNNKTNKDSKERNKLKLSPKKKELVDNFYETSIFDNDDLTANDDEREGRIMTELAMDRQNILDKSIFDLREILDEAHNRTGISDEVKEKLVNLFIEVPTQVPPTHLIETRLTIGPTKSQQELLKGYNLKLGIFSKEEDAILKRNWENFCTQYNFDDPQPFLTWKHDKDTILDHSERVKFVQYLGQQLGHRMLCSIYRRFKVIYKNVKKGRFTKDEDEVILKHMQQEKKKGNKFAPLVPVLNRSRIAIQLRYYRLISEDFNDKLKWDIDMDRKLVKHLMKELDVKTLKELKCIKIKMAVWKKISEKMEIPEFKLIIHWNFKLYTQIFAEDKICWDELKLKLFDMLYDMKIDDWRTVDWRAIASDFVGFTPQFIWFLVKNNVRHQVPQQFHYSCRKSIKFIHKYVVPKLMVSMTEYDSDGEGRNRKQLHRYQLDENNILQSYYY